MNYCLILELIKFMVKDYYPSQKKKNKSAVFSIFLKFISNISFIINRNWYIFLIEWSYSYVTHYSSNCT